MNKKAVWRGRVTAIGWENQEKAACRWFGELKFEENQEIQGVKGRIKSPTGIRDSHYKGTELGGRAQQVGVSRAER